LRALFSLYDISFAVGFASDLHLMGWEIICTKETYSVLKEAKIPATSIEAFTGISENYNIPPTLHPKIEHALTRNDPASRIDLVFDIPYPLTVGSDIGGLTLLALAIKGGKISVLTNADMVEIVKELKEKGIIGDKLREALISKTNVFIAQYYIQMLQQTENRGHGFLGTPALKLSGGENAYQIPCQLFNFPENKDPLALSRFKQLSGVEPCFTNLADLDNISHTLCIASEAFNKKFKHTPYLALAAKHGNACGFGADWESPEVALTKALLGNPTAIWGGEFVCNFPIQEDLAKLLYESDIRNQVLGSKYWMLDVVVAPSISSESVTILSQRKERKLFSNEALANPKLFDSAWSIRPVRGGFLRQRPANYILDFEKIELSGSNFSEKIFGSLILAWAVSWSSNLGGNEISFVKDLQLIGSGGGPATIIAANNALARIRETGHSAKSSIFAADAFFPFTDVPEILMQAGCNYGLVPEGGKHEQAVRQHFQNHSISMCYIPEQYRGFCRH